MNKRRKIVNWMLFLATIVIVVLVAFLVSSIIERRSEGQLYFQNIKPIDKWEMDMAVWGDNYPREYASYLQTADTSFRSKHGGNQMRDMLEEDPRLVVLWAGYGFAKDYNQGRGHYYAVKDIHNTLRTGGPLNENEGPMPNTCWTCKSPDVPRMIEEVGIAEFYKGKWASRGHQITNSIGCADCHDHETMNLTITRPALIEAFQRQGRDIIKNPPNIQEMRSLVCAQCHVEYYFKGDGKYLTFPWDKGLSVEAMEKYYDEYEFADWTHALSKAPMLKAQHPGYETFLTGIHAQRGLSCADCHMPYQSEGGIKYTNHHMVSPLNYIDQTCQVCHRESEKELIKNIYDRQDKIKESRDKLEELLVYAHVEAKAAWDAGATDDQMKKALTLIRHAQWRWDYAAAAHGASFHSPIEISRVIATGLVKAQDARLELQRILISLGHSGIVDYPDISTKDKAQKFIGLDMEKLIQEKKQFKEQLLPEWIKEI